MRTVLFRIHGGNLMQRGRKEIVGKSLRAQDCVRALEYYGPFSFVPAKFPRVQMRSTCDPLDFSGLLKIPAETKFSAADENRCQSLAHCSTVESPRVRSEVPFCHLGQSVKIVFCGQKTLLLLFNE